MMKQVEVYFSPIPDSNQQEFTIDFTDTKAGDLVMAQVAYEAPTGKDLDELEMDEFEVKARAEDGKVILLVTSLTGNVHDNFKINYWVNGSN